MVHGNPEWSYMWRKLIPAVSNNHRVLAFDLMGFGKSEKPNPTLHDFPHHARIVSSFIQSLGLRKIILAVHDWGGPFALHYAVRNPENIAGIIILNTFLTADYKIPPNIASKITPAVIKDSSVHPEAVQEETMKAYWAPFPDDEAKMSYQAFAQMFPDTPYHPSYKPLKEIEQGLGTLKIPILMIWGIGRSGPTYAERLSKMMSDCKLHTVKAGHFVLEDAPDESEKLIVDFLQTNSL
jgi:pimeloyl-ACP methyl ester carboxylesterase